MSKTNQKIKLRDGRILSFAEYGDPIGKVVFHFNGSGGSRLENPADDQMLLDLKIRYISTDRPGHGNSTIHLDRELLDWPDDINQIAESLKIDRFYLLGWSAGGPHALACAYKIPEKIIAASIVCGLAPPNRPNPFEGYKGFLWLMMVLGRKYPKLVYIFRKLAAKQINKSSSKFGDKFVKSLPKVDQIAFENKAIKDMLVADIKEGYKQGGDGPARDDIIINFPWNFDIREIKTLINIWQGDMDNNVPLNQGKYQAELLPNNQLHILKNKGHMLLLDEWKAILVDLVK